MAPLEVPHPIDRLPSLLRCVAFKLPTKLEPPVVGRAEQLAISGAALLCLVV